MEAASPYDGPSSCVVDCSTAKMNVHDSIGSEQPKKCRAHRPKASGAEN